VAVNILLEVESPRTGCKFLGVDTSPAVSIRLVMDNRPVVNNSQVVGSHWLVAVAENPQPDYSYPASHRAVESPRYQEVDTVDYS